MLVCYCCGKVIKECCDIYDRYETEEGKEVAVCGDCIEANDLEQRKDEDENR